MFLAIDQMLSKLRKYSWKLLGALRLLLFIHSFSLQSGALLFLERRSYLLQADKPVSNIKTIRPNVPQLSTRFLQTRLHPPHPHLQSLSPKWPVLLLPARSSLHLADPYSSLTPVGCLEVVPLGVIPHSGDLCSCPLCSITSQPGAQGVLTMRSVSSIQEPRSALRLQACRKMMCDSPP
ncbi:PREDICTED: uncharacterized protein LOC105580708 isoform X5 [Cercocebus atys]|uniref:uncharacterized protein LOC105580708 isoform X5 n=1 Tax=Cercocebus atys TaxID=9531 RepID=UPI0005F361A4|nr:PREDICTED: uncharacterized protein LOC105580708 isoform X5 [Cercocebus atys]